MNPLLDVKNLYVRFKTPDGVVTAVNDLNFTLNAGSTLGIVGESGSGKSQTAFALMGLLAANGEVEGSAIFEGKELVNLPNTELNKIRAEQISMIFQDPMTSLNPYMKIGEQLMEVLQLHKGYDKQTAFAESVKMFWPKRVTNKITKNINGNELRISKKRIINISVLPPT
jgi:oligopeptide transport system ATP-binding protein